MTTVVIFSTTIRWTGSNKIEIRVDTKAEIRFDVTTRVRVCTTIGWRV